MPRCHVVSLQAQCLPYEDYLLPAGLDPATGARVDQLLEAPPPLAGLRVLVAAAPDSLWGDHMQQILAAAGATVNRDHRVRARHAHGAEWVSLAIGMAWHQTWA